MFLTNLFKSCRKKPSKQKYKTRRKNRKRRGGGNFLTNPANATLQMQGEAITGINWLNFTNQQGASGLNLDLQCRVINNKSMLTIQNGPPENGVGMIYDSLYNPPPGAIAGLAVDAETNLLTYNEQPIMINQYLIFEIYDVLYHEANDN